MKDELPFTPDQTPAGTVSEHNKNIISSTERTGRSTAKSMNRALTKPVHKPSFTRYSHMLTLIACIGGILFGYNTGIISAVMLFYDVTFPDITYGWTQGIVSITPGFAAISCIAAGPSADRFGRKPIIIGTTFVFALGTVVTTIAMNLPILLVGRAIIGIAIGTVPLIYGGDEQWVIYDMACIAAMDIAEEERKESYGNSCILLRAYRTPSVRRAMLVGSSMQMFQQFVAINVIMYYTGLIIKGAGVEDNITTLWIACGIASMQAVGTFMPMWTMEKMGRRPTLLISCFGCILSLLLMGVAFTVINKNSMKVASLAETAGASVPVKEFELCNLQTSCDSCVTLQACGYCHRNGTDEVGNCLPKSSSATGYSPIGNCQAGEDRKEEYKFDQVCKTDYTSFPIIVMLIYLFAFAFGYGAIPWVYNAEIYPLWARSSCVSVSTVTNWTFNLVISLTFLSLAETIGKNGAFFLYAGISCNGLVVFYFFMPETRGLSIEEIEEQFRKPDDFDRASTQTGSTASVIGGANTYSSLEHNM